MRISAIALLSVILLLTNCNTPAIRTIPDTTKQADSDAVKKANNIDMSWEMISMIKLIANPKEYEGRRVIVKGYLNLQFEGDRLYLHKEDYKNAITENSLLIEGRGSKNWDDIMKCNNHYVLIEGNFSAVNGGSIANIGRAEIWEGPAITPAPPKPKKGQVKFPPPGK